MSWIKLIRIAIDPQSLGGLLRGELEFMSENGCEVLRLSSVGDVLKYVEVYEGATEGNVVKWGWNRKLSNPICF